MPLPELGEKGKIWIKTDDNDKKKYILESFHGTNLEKNLRLHHYKFAKAAALSESFICGYNDLKSSASGSQISTSQISK